MWRINGNGIFLKYKRRYIRLSIMKILNAVLPLVCILCFSSANAQKIYSVNSSYQADVKGSVSLSVSEASSLKPVDLR